MPPKNGWQKGAVCLQVQLDVLQNLGNDFVHVVVGVVAKTSAKDNVRTAFSQLLGLFEKFAVALVVDGIVGFYTGVPFHAVFPANDCFGQVDFCF